MATSIISETSTNSSDPLDILNKIITDKLVPLVEKELKKALPDNAPDVPDLRTKLISMLNDVTTAMPSGNLGKMLEKDLLNKLMTMQTKLDALEVSVSPDAVREKGLTVVDWMENELSDYMNLSNSIMGVFNGSDITYVAEKVKGAFKTISTFITNVGTLTGSHIPFYGANNTKHIAANFESFPNVLIQSIMDQVFQTDLGALEKFNNKLEK